MGILDGKDTKLHDRLIKIAEQAGGHLEFTDDLEASARGITELKFGLLLSICRAPAEALEHRDLWTAWTLLEDESVLKRLAEEGAREKAESCKRMGFSHWYLTRLQLGKVVKGKLVTSVGLVTDEVEGM